MSFQNINMPYNAIFQAVLKHFSNMITNVATMVRFQLNNYLLSTLQSNIDKLD